MTLTLTQTPPTLGKPFFMENDLVQFKIEGVEYHGKVKRVNKKTITISPAWGNWVYIEGGIKVDPMKTDILFG